MLRLLCVAALAALLSGCGEGRFVGIDKCLPDGSVAWWQFKNAQGNYEGAEASAANCEQAKK
ncbi:MAG TPA: hypothetical protein VE631_05725 [Alphaproteobacteria bacterium]|nr:hypothetical protein [Alphaproteobacteria bacterium]